MSVWDNLSYAGKFIDTIGTGVLDAGYVDTEEAMEVHLAEAEEVPEEKNVEQNSYADKETEILPDRATKIVSKRQKVTAQVMKLETGGNISSAHPRFPHIMCQWFFDREPYQFLFVYHPFLFS